MSSSRQNGIMEQNYNGHFLLTVLTFMVEFILRERDAPVTRLNFIVFTSISLFLLLLLLQNPINIFPTFIIHLYFIFPHCFLHNSSLGLYFLLLQIFSLKISSSYIFFPSCFLFIFTFFSFLFNFSIPSFTFLVVFPFSLIFPFSSVCCFPFSFTFFFLSF